MKVDQAAREIHNHLHTDEQFFGASPRHINCCYFCYLYEIILVSGLLNFNKIALYIIIYMVDIMSEIYTTVLTNRIISPECWGGLVCSGKEVNNSLDLLHSQQGS